MALDTAGPVNSTGRLFNYKRALQQMEDHDLVALVGATCTNSYYISGVRTIYDDWPYVEPYQAAIVPRSAHKPPTLVTMGLFLPTLVGGVPTWMPNVRLYDWLAIDKTVEEPDVNSPLMTAIEKFVKERVRGDSESNLVSATVQAFRDLGITKGRIAFDDLRLANHVKAQLPDIELVDGFEIFLAIRKVRTPRELGLLGYAARVNQLALEAVIQELRPGVKWSELAYLFKETWIKHGGRSVSDKGLYWGGKFNGEYIPDAFYLPDNDFVVEAGRYYLLEGEGQVLQYHADCNRSVFVGNPPARYLKGVDAVMRAYQAIERQLRPGVSTGEVYKTTIKIMEEHGVPYPQKTSVATHGVGLEFVEWYGRFPTQIAVPRSFTLEAGVTLGMDILYYGHTLGTFHFENGLMIHDDGPRSFYAPPNTARILPKGLIIKDGNTMETYCPADVVLAQERGIPQELVIEGSPVPSWCQG